MADAFETSLESKIISRLASGKSDHLGRSYVAALLEEFVISGPNGRHRCVVSEVAGCSIAQSKENSITW